MKRQAAAKVGKEKLRVMPILVDEMDQADRCESRSGRLAGWPGEKIRPVADGESDVERHASGEA